MKNLHYFSKSRLLFTLIALFMGISSSWAQKSLPYSYDFSTDLTTEGWTMESCHSNTKIESGAFRFYYNSTPPQYLISPLLETISSTVDVSFDYKVQSSTYPESFQVGYSTSTNAKDNFTWDTEVVTTNTAYTEYKTTFPADVRYVAIRYNSDNKYFLFIDNFKVCKTPTCITPTGLTTSNITSNSVQLSWTSDADAFNVQYKKATESDWTDVSGTVTSPYTLESLSPATNYQVRVRTYCDATDQSDWTDAVSFTTDCATITEFPFSENFNNLTSGIPMCWDNSEGTVTTQSYKWNYYATGHDGSCVRFNSANPSSGQYNCLKTPAMNFPSGKIMQLSFWYTNQNTGDFSIYISNDGGTTTTPLAENLSASSWTKKEVVIPTNFTENVTIIFKGTSNYGYNYIYLDDVTVEEAPNCIKPSGLTVGTVTANSAVLSWTVGDTEQDTWQVVFATDENFDPDSATPVSVGENPFTLTGLEKETTYYAFVRAYCSSTEQSDWSEKVSFTTTASCITPTGLTASSVTTNSATLTWTDETEQSAWEVSYSTTSGDSDNGTIVAVTEKTYTIENLTSGTTYYASVRAVNSDNDKSAWSTEISFVPGVLTVNDGTATNINIPVYGNMVDERLNNSQFIIPAESLTSIANSQINKLVFYTSTTNTNWGNATFNVYISETESTTFTNSALSSWNDMTKVYTGVLSVSKNKMEILLDDSYEYEGGNLMIGLNQTVKGSYTNTAWYGITTTNYAAIYNYNTTNTRQQFLPKTSIYYSPNSTAPKMAVDKSEIAFGLVEQNSEQTATFKIENKGKADLENITIACTDGAFSIDKTSVEKILRKDDDNYEAAVVTVTFNTETIGEFSGMITVSAEDQENIEITVSGIVKDPSKIFIDFADGKLPDEWTSVSTGTDTSSSYNWTAETGYARTSASSASYSYALTSPQVVFTEGEKVLFKTSRNTSYISNNSLAVEYSTNGTTWTTIETFSGDEYGLDSWTLREVTIPTADAKYIRFNGYNTKITDIYGGKLPYGAKFAINTDGTTTQDFGAVEQNADAEKTYTVTNNGNADLYLSIDAPEGFSIEGGNALLFTSNKGWNAVYVHAWNGEGDLTTWPGNPATYVGKNSNNEDQYAFVVPEGATGIVIDNGGSQQTQDINNFNVTGYYLTGDLYDSNKYWAESWGTAPSALKVAAGAPESFTVKMSTEAPGQKSGNVKLAFQAIGKTSFTIPVTGFVYDSSLPCVKFDDNQLPENWTNASWTFANGIATGKSSSAYLTTPKLKFSEGDFIVLKARRFDSDTSDYLTVQGSSDNGSTWTAYSKKLQNADGLTYPDFGTIVLSDIPTTVNKLRFVGFYAEIDEIMGLNYAPVLSVTTGEPAAAVTSPTNYDFGECAADATVTYTFANAGAGTINITNVVITGDGAASYSTNWTESVAAPFDLTITRIYDATKAGVAQDAVVTVTTTDGNLIINVTGTDKAANAPELAVSTNAIDFGKVTADAAETVTVTNNGTGLMTVDIVSDSEAFEVSTAQLTEIGAGESKTFDITFKFSTPYGVKNGKVTVTPTYDTEAAQEITVTGKAKDPNVWSEDFTANELPTGWNAGSNWTIADGVAKGAYEYGSTTYLTTPPLTVSATTDELTFDYEITGTYVNIAVQKSKDGGAWADCSITPTVTSVSSPATGTATITGLEAGDYQFRFKNDNYNLDNFEGFKLNLPDHMASITAYSIPESSLYSVTMKEGQSFDATVTVKEMRGVAEELTAKLYMGETVIGTQTGSVTANGTETLTITATPNVAAPDGAQMHIEVEWAGTTMTTEAVTRYVDAITNLTLDETSSDAITAGTYDNVTLKRTFIAGWNTVCLPFTISDAVEIFGEGSKVYEFNSYSDDGTLGFKTTTTLTASYPYIVYIPSEITGDLLWNNITIASSDVEAFYTRKTDNNNNAAYFRGTYAPIAAPGMDGKWGVTSEAKIAKGTDEASIKGFRAYFELPDGANARLSFFDDATGITTIIGADELNDDKAYNLSGQRVQNPKKGLYIVNGKKVVIK